MDSNRSTSSGENMADEDYVYGDEYNHVPRDQRTLQVDRCGWQERAKDGKGK